MDSKTTIASLRKKVIAFRNARKWKKFHNPKDLGIALIGEANEVLEHFRFKNSKEIKQMLKGGQEYEDLKHELADTLHALLLLSHEFNVDLSDAFDDKLKKLDKKYPVKEFKGKHTNHYDYKRKRK
ncbi:MAG: nucleotide pyrophosphohydrolase [Candidatus Micrarchaeota archaeon]